MLGISALKIFLSENEAKLQASITHREYNRLTSDLEGWF